MKSHDFHMKSNDSRMKSCGFIMILVNFRIIAGSLLDHCEIILGSLFDHFYMFIRRPHRCPACENTLGRPTDVQICRYTDIQTYKCTDIQIPDALPPISYVRHLPWIARGSQMPPKVLPRTPQGA